MKTIQQFSVSVLLASTSVFSSSVLAYEIDPVTFLQLPRHCQAWVASSARAGKVRGLQVDLSAYEINLNNLLGSVSIGMNQYCPALGDLIKLEGSVGKFLSDAERSRRLMLVLKGINYQLRQTGDRWNESNAWFYAEVMKNRAYTYHLLGENQNAINDYSESIDAYPPYLPAYWGLADIHEEMGESDKAIDVLQKAEQYARGKKFAKEIEERIVRLQSPQEIPLEKK